MANDNRENSSFLELREEILVVGEIVDDRRAVERNLTEQGYVVRCVHDPQQALAIARRQAPALLLLAADLPGMSGYELCTAIKAQPESVATSVIFMMTLDELAHLDGVYRAGGAGFVIMPIQPENLLATVRTQLALLQTCNVNPPYENHVSQHSDGSVAPLDEAAHEPWQSETGFRADAVSTLVGFWDWDRRSDSVYYSDRFKMLLGYAPDEISTSIDEFWRRCHPDDEQMIRSALAKHLEERVPYLTSFRLQSKSGEFRWFRSHGQALWDDSDGVIRMFGYIVDISEQKRYEEALLESEELFRSLMEQSPLAIELLTPDGRIGQVNAAWKRLWAVTDEEAAQIVSNYNMLTDQQVTELGIRPLVESAFAGEPAILPPVQYDGSQATEEIGLEDVRLHSPWVQCHLYPIKNTNGDVTRVVNTYMDITELKWAEQDAREQRDALARVGRATLMGQLTGSISHELNQPLTGILSNAQAAEIMIDRDQYELAEIAAILADIASDAMRAGELIRNLRDLFREQKGEFSPVELNTVIDETIRLLRSEFVIQGVGISTVLAPSIPKVDGNWVQIQQVLVNLIMNGLEAMKGVAPHARQIRILSERYRDVVKVWVEDSGVGIEEAVIKRMFEPFATWKPSGTGMGLAICTAIIEAHGGSLWAENRNSSGGAIVGFTLPILEEITLV